jgi:hypothetical protein
MTRRLDEHLHRAVRAQTEIREANRRSPERFARVRAACQPSALVDADVHAARIVNTVNRLEAPR